jgi:hypothetical protein
MTSDELRRVITGEVLCPVDPLWEIAYQLAVMNERNASGDEQAVDAMLKKVGLGSKVGAGSETEVRGKDKPDLDMPDWICQCGYTNLAVRSKCRNFICGLPRPADRRTTPPNPQTSSIQTKEDLRCSIEDAMRRSERQRTAVPDDSSEI